jgi:hypothetical protein
MNQHTETPSLVPTFTPQDVEQLFLALTALHPHLDRLGRDAGWSFETWDAVSKALSVCEIRWTGPRQFQVRVGAWAFDGSHETDTSDE